MKCSITNLPNRDACVEFSEIEVFKNQYSDRDYKIQLHIPEFTCICPKTGLPDFGTIVVEYCPDKWCIELKSFKLYIVEYRNVGMFHENVVNKILDDFVKVCKPRWARVEGVIMPRGGIQTTVESIYEKKYKKKK